jgi:hypothetical protein
VTTPTVPEVITQITRYEVSVLPVGDINRRYFSLYVELTRRGGWIVNDGHGGFNANGNWEPGHLNVHEFADHDDALNLARRLAPGITVNGHTATDAYRRSLT